MPGDPSAPWDPPTPFSGSPLPSVPILSPPLCFACALVAAEPGPACTALSSLSPSCVTPAPRCCRWQSPCSLQEAPFFVPGTASTRDSSHDLGLGGYQEVWVGSRSSKISCLAISRGESGGTSEPIRDPSVCPRLDCLLSVFTSSHFQLCGGCVGRRERLVRELATLCDGLAGLTGRRLGQHATPCPFCCQLIPPPPGIPTGESKGFREGPSPDHQAGPAHHRAFHTTLRLTGRNARRKRRTEPGSLLNSL